LLNRVVARRRLHRFLHPARPGISNRIRELTAPVRQPLRVQRRLSRAEITLENLAEPIRAFVDRETLVSARDRPRQEPSQMDWKLSS
jgi:hypothetical protein